MNGGVTALAKWGKANPDLFYPMLTKLLPSELAEAGYGQDNKIQVLILPPDHAQRQVVPAISITEAEQSNDKPLDEQGGGLCRQDGVAFREPKA